MMFCSLSLVLLAACSQEVPSAPAPSGSPPPAATAMAGQDDCPAPPTSKDDGKLLSITLIDTPVCSKATAATATAKWDVSPLNVASVSIYVNSPGNDKKLWVEGHATGAETTGPWVFEHTCFTLQNKDTGGVLASRLVDKIPCTH